MLGFFYFFGNGDAHLVDNVQHTVFIHGHVMRERDRFAIVEKFFQTVDQLQDVHKLLRFSIHGYPYSIRFLVSERIWYVVIFHINQCFL